MAAPSAFPASFLDAIPITFPISLGPSGFTSSNISSIILSSSISIIDSSVMDIFLGMLST